MSQNYYSKQMEEGLNEAIANMQGSVDHIANFGFAPSYIGNMPVVLQNRNGGVHFSPATKRLWKQADIAAEALTLRRQHKLGDYTGAQYKLAEQMAEKMEAALTEMQVEASTFLKSGATTDHISFQNNMLRNLRGRGGSFNPQELEVRAFSQRLAVHPSVPIRSGNRSMQNARILFFPAHVQVASGSIPFVTVLNELWAAGESIDSDGDGGKLSYFSKRGAGLDISLTSTLLNHGGNLDKAPYSSQATGLNYSVMSPSDLFTFGKYRGVSSPGKNILIDNLRKYQAATDNINGPKALTDALHPNWTGQITNGVWGKFHSQTTGMDPWDVMNHFRQQSKLGSHDLIEAALGNLSSGGKSNSDIDIATIMKFQGVGMKPRVPGYHDFLDNKKPNRTYLGMFSEESLVFTDEEVAETVSGMRRRPSRGNISKMKFNQMIFDNGKLVSRNVSATSLFSFQDLGGGVMGVAKKNRSGSIFTTASDVVGSGGNVYGKATIFGPTYTTTTGRKKTGDLFNVSFRKVTAKDLFQSLDTSLTVHPSREFSGTRMWGEVSPDLIDSFLGGRDKSRIRPSPELDLNKTLRNIRSKYSSLFKPTEFIEEGEENLVQLQGVLQKNLSTQQMFELRRMQMSSDNFYYSEEVSKIENNYKNLSKELGMDAPVMIKGHTMVLGEDLKSHFGRRATLLNLPYRRRDALSSSKPTNPWNHSPDGDHVPFQDAIGKFNTWLNNREGRQLVWGVKSKGDAGHIISLDTIPVGTSHLGEAKRTEKTRYQRGSSTEVTMNTLMVEYEDTSDISYNKVMDIKQKIISNIPLTEEEKSIWKTAGGVGKTLTRDIGKPGGDNLAFLTEEGYNKALKELLAHPERLDRQKYTTRAVKPSFMGPPTLHESLGLGGGGQSAFIGPDGEEIDPHNTQLLPIYDNDSDFRNSDRTLIGFAETDEMAAHRSLMQPKWNQENGLKYTSFHVGHAVNMETGELYDDFITTGNADSKSARLNLYESSARHVNKSLPQDQQFNLRDMGKLEGDELKTYADDLGKFVESHAVKVALILGKDENGNDIIKDGIGIDLGPQKKTFYHQAGSGSKHIKDIPLAGWDSVTHHAGFTTLMESKGFGEDELEYAAAMARSEDVLRKGPAFVQGLEFLDKIENLRIPQGGMVTRDYIDNVGGTVNNAYHLVGEAIGSSEPLSGQRVNSILEGHLGYDKGFITKKRGQLAIKSISEGNLVTGVANFKPNHPIFNFVLNPDTVERGLRGVGEGITSSVMGEVSLGAGVITELITEAMKLGGKNFKSLLTRQL